MKFSTNVNIYNYMSTLPYELISACRKYPEKHKCGDAVNYRYLTDQNVLIVALADGVGSKPCDWKASAYTCETLCSYLEEHLDTKDIPLSLEKAIHRVNQQVVSYEGNCRYMMSTLVVVIWDFLNKMLYYDSIGDSRIYTIHKKHIAQLSKDEVKTVLRRKPDGKLMISSGSTFVSEGITNAIGSSEMQTHVNSITTQEIQAILLASDGFYNCKSSFERDIQRLVSSLSLESEKENLLNSYKEFQTDDMSFALARVKNYKEEGDAIAQAILQKKSLENFSKKELSDAILVGVEKGIKERNTADVMLFLSLCNTKFIDLGRSNLANFLSQMQAHSFESGGIYQEIVLMMRKSRLA